MTSTSTARSPVDEKALQAALSSSTRPAPPSALTASLTFAWRGMLKIKHVPEQLLDVTLTPVLFTLMFTYLFGGALAGSTGEYLQFLLPGILVMTVTFTTVYSGVTVNTDVTKGVIDRFRSLPVWQAAPLVGAVLADSVRYLLASAVTIVLGLALGFRPEAGLSGVVAAVMLLLVFAFGFTWVFATLGLLMRTPNAVMNLGFTALFPVTFLSNVFVDPDTMPSWLQTVVGLNPITHLVMAVRGLMAGTVMVEQLGWVLLASAVLTLVFAPLTLHLYRNRK
ncbi:MAG TPA: ABC transporter permease [Rubrobacteraceae bacterium]|nr:ABC transporter permease [Rubrobacteraceae bacterium]